MFYFFFKGQSAIICNSENKYPQFYPSSWMTFLSISMLWTLLTHCNWFVLFFPEMQQFEYRCICHLVITHTYRKDILASEYANLESGRLKLYSQTSLARLIKALIHPIFPDTICLTTTICYSQFVR